MENKNSKFPLTKEQQDILDFVVNNRTKNLMVKAYAGCGKTSTLIMILNMMKSVSHSIMLAFNKSIQTEMQEKAPQWIKCKTLNSEGYSILRNFYPSAILEPKKNNYLVTRMFKEETILLEKFYESNEVQEEFDYIIETQKLSIIEIKRNFEDFVKKNYYEFVKILTSVKIQGIHPDDYDLMGYDHCMMGIHETYDLDIDIKGLLFIFMRKVVRDNLAICNRMNDFDDQIYVPVVNKLKFFTYNLIIIDECQDLSSLNHRFIKMMTHGRTRIIAMGDENQCIYGFRGSDIYSMKTLEKMFNMEILKLTESFRCSKKVVDNCKEFVKDFKANDNNKEGEVITETPFLKDVETFKEKSLIVCRINAPLISVTIKLIKEGKGFNCLFSKDLLKLKFFSSKNWTKNGLEAFDEKLEQYRENEIKKLDEEFSKMDDSYKSLYRELTEKYDCYKAIINWSETMEEAIRYYNSITSRGEGHYDLTLSTIHKIKGMEYENVYFLDQDKMYKRCRNKDEWIQERNLDYVARSRSKDGLYFIKSDEVPETKKNNVTQQKIYKNRAKLEKTLFEKERKFEEESLDFEKDSPPWE